MRGIKWLYLILVLSLLFYQVYKHEEAHQQIFQYFGVKSAVTFGEPSFTTPDPIDIANLSAQDLRDLYALQAENEVMGYHMIALYVLAAFVGFVVLQTRS